MTTNLPSVQKAWRIVRRGEPAKALILDENVPVPKNIPPGYVLVKVQAAALNPIGYLMMKWLPNSFMKRIAENDLAAQVVDPDGSEEFQVGDQVFGFLRATQALRTGGGSLGSYTLVPAADLTHRPANISPVEASGLTLTGLTAWQALFDLAKLEPGQTIFVNGGSTSVGAFAIQLAKAKGCKVVACASGKNERFVRSLGADEFIDYTTAPVHEQLLNNPPNPKFHVILEAVGLADTSLFTSSEAYLAPNGIFVTVGPKPHDVLSVMKILWNLVLQPRWAGGTNRVIKFVQVKSDKTKLDEFQRLVAEGKVKPVVDSVYEFEDALKAYERLMSGRATGKVVIKVSD